MGGILVLLALLLGAGWFFAGEFLDDTTGREPFFLRNCRDIDRSNYGIIPEVFDSLPPAPKCFYSVVEAFRQRQLRDGFFFSEAYYLQPEFYPEFIGNGITQWTNPNPTHYGLVGYGSFPLRHEIVMRPGETKQIRLFVHAGFGVRSFQGMGVRVQYKYPETPKALTVELDPASNGFLLGPTFPRFDPQWARPIEVTLRVNPASPPQDLEMTFYSTPPSPESAQSFVDRVTGRYADATSYLGERPLATAVVQIR